eukprot:417626-Prymnesium_polylepis.1
MPSARSSSQRCEVSIPEPGFEGSWFTARKLRQSGPSWLVRYDELEVSEESNDKLQEWVAESCIRPAPPTPPADFLDGLTPGAALDLFYEGG